MDRSKISVKLKEIKDCWTNKMSNLNENESDDCLMEISDMLEKQCDVDKVDDENLLLSTLNEFKCQIEEDLKVKEKLNGCVLDEAKKKKVKRWYDKVNKNYKRYSSFVYPYMMGYSSNDNQNEPTGFDGDGIGGDAGSMMESANKTKMRILEIINFKK